MHANKLNYIAYCIRNKMLRCSPYVAFSTCRFFTSTAYTIDAFTNEFQRSQTKLQGSNINMLFTGHERKFYFSKSEFNNNKEYEEMSNEEIDQVILNNLCKIKDKQIVDMIKYFCDHKKFISENTLKKLFRSYSTAGKPDVVIILQKYSSNVHYNFHKRNGDFEHCLATAHCFKGNSEKGLSILLDCYTKYEGLRAFYRILFRELIHDSVLNRSEATLVIFKKYVLEFSTKWNENYPLVCFWHICWSSTWYSDQILADELLETSKSLQNVIKEKATVFSITILREYNDDAVLRLLQTLLKYKMMTEYTNVLQVLFQYKLRNRDIRGCTEILRNCETLGVSLTAELQGRYIRLLINNKDPVEKSPVTKVPSKDFKLKF